MKVLNALELDKIGINPCYEGFKAEIPYGIVEATAATLHVYLEIIEADHLEGRTREDRTFYCIPRESSDTHFHRESASQIHCYITCTGPSLP